jgi:Fe2+ transport system protein FeoA
MTTLSHMPRGARGTVSRLPTSTAWQEAGRLGLNPGAEVAFFKPGQWSVIVEVHGARLALGRGQADRVTVDMAPAAPCAVDVAADQ